MKAEQSGSEIVQVGSGVHLIVVTTKHEALIALW